MATVPDAKYYPFSQENYLLCMGVIKYAPVLLLSVIGSHWISNNLSKNLVVALVVLSSAIIIALSAVPIESFRYLSIFFVYILFSVIYEPVVEILSSYWGEKRQNYLLVNGLVTLARTSARYLGPILITSFIGRYLNLQLPQLSALLLVFLASALVFCDFPKTEKIEEGVVTRLSFKESMQKICQSKLSLGLLVIYCIFYLGVSYLEYLVTLLDPQSKVTLAQLFSSLGLGFVVSNILIMIMKGKLKQPLIFFLSLLLTGSCLVLLPFVSQGLLPRVMFLIGIGNGFAVPISLSIFQKLLGRKLIGHFIGVLDASINMCALISLGVGYVLFRTVGSSYIFVFDGTMILVSAFVWLMLDKSEVLSAK
ncbi:MAG: hypothetical protein R3A80_07560 [Bdellovibrionota bacterium]